MKEWGALSKERAASPDLTDEDTARTRLRAHRHNLSESDIELKLLGSTCCGSGWVPLHPYVATIRARLASAGYASRGKQYFSNRPSTELTRHGKSSILAGFEPDACHCV